jgi:glycosyltransferase involved in cell wall biosynthesis
MMRALARRGHEVILATESPPVARALDGLPLAGVFPLDQVDPSRQPLRLTYFQERFRRYWGISQDRLQSLRTLVETRTPDAVIAVGLEGLPYLAAAPDTLRIWYAADEWVRHHLSQVLVSLRSAHSELTAAAIKGAYERAYAPLADRIWVVSPSERSAMRVVTGTAHVDVIPNGVDAEVFVPLDEAPAPYSAVFWGQMAFEPNRRAVAWFCRRVWPRVRAEVPDARFTILGSNPPATMLSLSGRHGISVLPDLPDLRPSIARHAVVVLPFVTGGGIKNKLLEAAAMGKPIVATPQALLGLRTPPPVVTASSPARFADALIRSWADPAEQKRLGAAAREWVRGSHTWAAAAEMAMRGLEESRRSIALPRVG